MIPGEARVAPDEPLLRGLSYFRFGASGKEMAWGYCLHRRERSRIESIREDHENLRRAAQVLVVALRSDYEVGRSVCGVETVFFPGVVRQFPAAVNPPYHVFCEVLPSPHARTHTGPPQHEFSMHAEPAGQSDR